MTGLRIVRRLQQLYPALSAARLKRAVLDGQVTVDGIAVDDAGAVVSEGAAVVWDRNREIRRHVDTSLVVLYEDDDAVAVLKPAGLLTHPTEAKERDSLLSRVSLRAQRRFGARGRAYVSVVHRLDKETSGVLVFARSRRGLVDLQAQLKAHAMDRRYLAVVEGDVRGDSGTFDRDLVEDRGDRRRGVAKPGEKGIRAVTEWQVLERFGLATLVEARLRTGRTHQIRVHFAHAGHPLVGDRVYRDPRRPPFPVSFPRQALHAGRLGWVTPEGRKVVVEAEPPPGFKALLAELRRRSAKTPDRSLRSAGAGRKRPAPPPGPSPATRGR
jgi:23S rRNA pseudouridine1911/1915/1917 synthase